VSYQAEDGRIYGDDELYEFLTRDLPPIGREEREAIAERGNASMTAYVNRSSDEKIRADHPGISHADIQRWRERAGARKDLEAGQ